MNFDIANINNSISWIPWIYLNFNHCFLMYFNSDLSNLWIYFLKDLLGPSELRYDKVWPIYIYIYIKVFVLKVLMIISCSNLTINNWWLLECDYKCMQTKEHNVDYNIPPFIQIIRLIKIFSVLSSYETRFDCFYIFLKTLYVISLGIDRMANYVYMRTNCALCRS